MRGTLKSSSLVTYAAHSGTMDGIKPDHSKLFKLKGSVESWKERFLLIPRQGPAALACRA